MRARAIGLRAGLRFVYTDNVNDPTTAYTFCPTCSALIIERSAINVIYHALHDDGTCASCGTDLGFIVNKQYVSDLER
jgi:pyruvate formate lyase activating enzyme